MSFSVNRRPLVESFMDTTSSGLYLVREEDESTLDDAIGRISRYSAGASPQQSAVVSQHDVDLEENENISAGFRGQEQSFFERSQNAKRIRRQQLEDWHRREDPKTGTGRVGADHDGLAQSGSVRHRKSGARKRKKTVMFEWNVLLMDAVLRDEIYEVDRLLSTFEELEHSPRTELVNCRSPDGLTPLHQCCIENLEKMARLLIKNGADLRAADSELWTPFHAAATCGHLPMVKLLMEAAKALNTAGTPSAGGASSTSDTPDAIVKDMLLAINSDGNMPFDLCENPQTLAFIEHEMQLRGITQQDIESKRHKKEVDMLRDLQQYIEGNLRRSGSFRQRGSTTQQSLREMWAKFTASNKMPNSVMLHIAAANGYIEALDLLLKNKFPVDLEDEDGWLPIHAAVAWNQPEAARRLVEAGADITARVRGTNETALDLAHAADLSQDLADGEKFRDSLILWDTAYKTRCAEEARNAKSDVGRHASSESITSAPNSSSPLLKRSSPRLPRVQRRSSLKDKEDLIALLHTLGAHDLHSSERNQGSLGKFARSPGGSLRDRNPTLPNVPEEAVASSAIVHIGDGDADLINQTISPELLSNLLRNFEDDPAVDDEDSESVAEQFLRDAAESLNQIDQPVTLSQLKHRRNRFRLLKRKEKPFMTVKMVDKDSLRDSLIGEEVASPRRNSGCLPVNGGHAKVESLTAPQKSHGGGGIVDSTEMKKFSQTKEEGPVGGGVQSSPNLLNFAKKKKDKMYNIPSFRPGTKRDKEPSSDESSSQQQQQQQQKSWPRHSNGCCIIA